MLIVGLSMMGAAIVMMLVGAAMFTMTAPPPRIVNVLGSVCFVGFLPVGLIGFGVFIASLVLRLTR